MMARDDTTYKELLKKVMAQGISEMKENEMEYISDVASDDPDEEYEIVKKVTNNILHYLQEQNKDYGFSTTMTAMIRVVSATICYYMDKKDYESVKLFMDGIKLMAADCDVELDYIMKIKTEK